MALKPHRRLKVAPGASATPAAALALALAAGSALPAGPASAQQAGYGQTLGTSPQERQIYGSGGSGTGGAPIDAKNPIDLINQIRRSSALDDATPPSTAVDRALRDLEAGPAAGMPTPGASLKGP